MKQRSELFELQIWYYSNRNFIQFNILKIPVHSVLGIFIINGWMRWYLIKNGVFDVNYTMFVCSRVLFVCPFSLCFVCLFGYVAHVLFVCLFACFCFVLFVCLFVCFTHDFFVCSFSIHNYVVFFLYQNQLNTLYLNI